VRSVGERWKDKYKYNLVGKGTIVMEVERELDIVRGISKSDLGAHCARRSRYCDVMVWDRRAHALEAGRTHMGRSQRGQILCPRFDNIHA
jgi:hypothetical protein